MLRAMLLTVGGGRFVSANSSRRQPLKLPLAQLPFNPTIRGFSANPYKPRTKEVLHPFVAAPENVQPAQCFKACLDPMQLFVPKDYYRQKEIELLRSGNNLGDDFPYNLLPNWKVWSRRKYNTTIKSVAWRESKVKGVEYLERTNRWQVQWNEYGRHRIRTFRAGYSIVQGRKAAEKFAMDLRATGHVDNCRSERHQRMKFYRSHQQLRFFRRRDQKIQILEEHRKKQRQTHKFPRT
eukprot:GHVS01001700.1.p1 GENE.GHVS01001700.1~~GHVS01001700.1.p1  ORF type:complete len:237 (-),score=28.76 GHVS01001700.1:143-853(-)